MNHFSGDTFATHAKLHKHGILLLPIIIPESDLENPVIDLDLDVETDSSVSDVSAGITPQTEPNPPEPSLCAVSLCGTSQSQSMFSSASQSQFILATQNKTETD